ncbi:PREDICTED: protein RETICULATA-RELATED 1, chloroplastic-like [Lupinus angustifolius]|uniref:protein RETICULATA-RELATED 1, chloroplastic-like n=1 Tax=Lupinus angustifolius TaxID=3871 RepID=UPI00092F4A85|nr:PREDICTED: protein RETICULATA-RELATED 1, chloroplastic-like [Lupinus angustifolius]
MAHSIMFHSPLTSRLSLKPSSLPLPTHGLILLPVNPAAKLRLRVLTVKAFSEAAEVESGNGSVSSLERCFVAPSSPATGSALSSSLAGSGTVMKGQYGALGSVTLEKSKLDTTQKQTKSSPELDIGGGSGGLGKNISHGGGDGGDDNGDDDDYFDDFDDGDEGDEGGLFRRRIILEELFDRKFVDAVLNEWQKTMMDLPAGFRQAYEMGLVSSAQMVKFLATNARPTTSRFISRTFPQGMSRAFIGRLLADPAFIYRFLLEGAASIGFSVWWEFESRKGRIKQEWDLALINVLTVAACNAVVVWSLAPCRSYGNTFRFDLQNTLQKLPNNIFENSYPFREFDLQKRALCFLYKAAELCMVGLSAGAVQGALSNTLASKKEGRLSVTVPSVSSNAFGYGAFLGIYANLRYQLLCGFDRAMISRFDVIGVALFFSTAFRVMNVQLGETSRRTWLGVEADPLAQSDDHFKVYTRSSENVEKSSSKWFISNNALVSGLGLLGIKQGKVDSTAESSAPKARRKRIVRKKVVA